MSIKNEPTVSLGQALASRLLVGRQSGDDRLGVLAAATSGMPAATMPSGDRVDAVVGDDVEAVVTLNDVGHVELFGRDWFGANPKITHGPSARRSVCIALVDCALG